MVVMFASFGRAIKVAMTDWDNSDRREIGKGFVGTLFEREYREYLPSELEEQIDDMDEHRSARRCRECLLRFSYSHILLICRPIGCECVVFSDHTSLTGRRSCRL